MKILGNILWFVFAGWVLWLAWILVGVLWCITILGIPIGLQCFKMAGLVVFPFGKDILYTNTGAMSLLGNILWLLLSGWQLALGAASLGILFCITIVGIPFGLQCFKIARLGLFPFGAQIVPIPPKQ